MSNQLMKLFGGAKDGYALDRYKTDLAAAYSLRRLLTSYKGAAIRVREDSGNTEADIGFDSSGNLDTTALLAHTGANSGYVVTWYDQKGSLNATHATAGNQPRIVSSGTVDVDGGGLPQIIFDGSNDYLVASATTKTFPHLFAACYPSEVNRRSLIAGVMDVSGVIINSKWAAGETSVVGNATVATYSAGHMLLAVLRLGVNNYTFAVNGVNSTGGSDGGWRASTRMEIGCTQQGLSLFWKGGIQEILSFSATQDRATVEGIINGYWGIY